MNSDLPNNDAPAEQHLSTDHLMGNLRARTISSGVVTVFAQGIKFLLTMGSTVFLSRLLSPSDFGLVAMVMTTTGFLKVFKEAGLSVATVQSDKISQAQVSNLFWINILLSGISTLIIAAASPVLAWFFRDPRLIGITLALSTTFLLTGAAVQHLAILNRQMRFKAIAVVEVGGMLSAVVIGILMAKFDCGYWALVVFQITMPAVSLVLVWLISKWRPQLPSRNSGMRPLLRFGADLTASNFITSLAAGIDSMLIGRFSGPDQVGLYSRGGALVRRPLDQMMTPISTVFVPVLSRLQDQVERYRRIFMQIYQATALLSFAFVGLCLPLARPIINVVLGPKWDAVSAIFAAFTVTALFNPLAIFCCSLFESQGRGKDFLFANTTISITSILSFIVGLPYGATGVAVAYAVSCVAIQLPIMHYFAGRKGPITASNLWLGFVKQVPVFVIVLGATYATLYFVTAAYSPIIQIVTGVLAGLIAGAAFVYVYKPARQCIAGLWLIVRDLRSKA